MTDDAHASHELWDELVAAHALHALEPEEELRLMAHVGGCSACRAALDDFTLVAAQLGSLADDDTPPPAWRDLRPHVIGTTEDAPARPVLRRLPSQRQQVATRLLAAAAAAVVLAGGAVTGWQLSRPGTAGGSMTAALTACREQTGCRVIQLHGSGGDNAAVLVDAGRASLVPLTLPAPATDRMYVLWQLPRDGSPIPVVALRDAKRQTASVPLVTGYSDTAAFAVSLEPTGTMPTRPTDVVAVGAATA